MASIHLKTNTLFGGSGFSGPISGEGTVSLAGQILTAPSSSVGRIAAILSTPGGLSGNAALALTESAPLTAPPSRIDLFLAPTTPALPGDRFAGALLVPASFDLSAALAATDLRLFVADPAGQIDHLGQSFREAQPDDQLTWSVVAYPQGNALEILKGGTPGTYEQWRKLFFSSPTERAADAISGPGASAAGDGFANLLRYGHGIGPHAPLSALLPQLASTANGGQVFRLRLATEMPDLAWLVRASPDLSSWTETLFDSRVDSAPPPDAMGWSAIIIPADRSRLFLRLELLLVLP
jgi:hypothetical protein